MSKPESVYDGLPYIYAENLHGKRVSLTIKGVKSGVEFTSADGHKKIGFDVSFAETKKILGLPGVTVRRQIADATGTENPAEMVGHKITLYSVPSKKAATGIAIRIARSDPRDIKATPKPATETPIEVTADPPPEAGEMK